MIAGENGEEKSPGTTRRLDFASWMLLAANTVPLIGVLFFDWDAGIILIAYWGENLVVGFYNQLKILCSPGHGPGEILGKLFMMAFFLVHYGGFCAVHGLFVFAFVEWIGKGGREGAEGADLFPDPAGGNWPGPLIFVQLLVHVFATVLRAYGQDIILPLLALTFSHGVSFVQNFILREEYKEKSPKELMAAPYGRIVVMHIAIIAAGVPVMFLGSPLPLLVILVGLKMIVDLRFHRASHRRKDAADV